MIMQEIEAIGAPGNSTMESNNHDANKYAELSRWCIAEAENYLRRRRNIQASEKGWGATAQALKAAKPVS